MKNQCQLFSKNIKYVGTSFEIICILFISITSIFRKNNKTLAI